MSLIPFAPFSELGEGGLKIFDDLKLVHCPRSLAPTLVTLPPMSLIPFASFGGDDVPFRIQISAF